MATGKDEIEVGFESVFDGQKFEGIPADWTKEDWLDFYMTLKRFGSRVRRRKLKREAEKNETKKNRGVHPN